MRIKKIKGVFVIFIVILLNLNFFILAKAEEGGVGKKVILIGIDAADWHFIDPLLKQGKLPNFQSILENACYGNLSTITRKPIGGAPMQWTSLATGKSYLKHGIIEYYPYHPGLNSKMRRTKAIWNILSENNIKVGIVGWWATWPAEEVNGYMVSNYTKYRAHPIGDIKATKEEKLQLTYTGTVYLDEEGNLNQTYPNSFYGQIEPIIKEKEQIKDAVIHSQFRNLKENRQKFYDIKWNYIANEIFADIGLLLLNKPDLDFISVIMYGLDVAYHRNYGATPNILEDYYIYIDKKLGEYLNKMDKEVTIIIVSEHGHAGKKDHIYEAIDGIIVIKGPNIKRNYYIKDASVLDVAPTILYLFNLAIPNDIDGRVLMEVFKDKYVKKHPVKKIATYEDIDRLGPLITINSSPFDEVIYKRMMKIGYFEGMKK